jgi:hypothetical protein|tara:strand:- start:2775 stop:3839 length:1065 start_codon:yes stop_codon:yes gene_type:complete
MSRLSLWNPTKTNDFTFIDRIVGEHIYAGGTGVNIHKYIGVHETPDEKDPTRPSSAGQNSEVFIQDILFLENRDRKYDKNVFELRGQYNLGDNDGFDLTQFGMFLANDTLMMNFHTESMVDAMGRKLMAGDVLELPHLRDDLLLGSDEAVNRFYVVTDASRPAEGFDPRWWSHLWRVKLGPISDSQEYRDILGTGEQEEDLRNLISTYKSSININDKLLEQAERDVPYDPTYKNTAHLYFDETVPDKPAPAIEFMSNDGVPLNGLSLVGSGSTFPGSSNDGDYFLRTDFTPNRLFKKNGTRWLNSGTDNRGTWAAANRILSTFINNDNITSQDEGGSITEKQNLSKVVKPKTDN